MVIDVCDSEYAGPGERVGTHEYEALLAAHRPLDRLECAADEWDAIAVSYTSGTTGEPKGVVTSHRGAYLNAVCNAVDVDDAALPGLSVDPADVPLQRLVLPVDDRHARRHPCVPPPRRGRRDPCGDPRPQGRPLLRRADRPQHADRRARRAARGDRPSRPRHGGGGRAVGGDDRGHGADRLRRHPHLRPHRGVRAGRRSA